VIRTGALLTALSLLAACSSGGDPEARRLAATADDPGPSRSAGCETGARVDRGVSNRTVTSGGVERVYQLHVPESYDPKLPLPLVLGLHALTVRYEVVGALHGFADMGEQYDFIAVFPSGRFDATVPYWHAAPTTTNRDVAFLTDLLDQLESELCIDTAKVYATGMSNGAQMSSLLACRRPERITAVAPIAGAEFYEECEHQPVPVIAFHGTADPIVTYDGGGLNAATISREHHWNGEVPPGLPEHRGVDEAMRRWADNNGCDRGPVEDRVTPEVRRRTWRDCAADTVLYIVEEGGHSIPGRPVPGFENSFGLTTTDIDATQLMFEFFLGVPAGRSGTDRDLGAAAR
jgi:polyhydroxybutyrate depolymerase